MNRQRVLMLAAGAMALLNLVLLRRRRLRGQKRRSTSESEYLNKRLEKGRLTNDFADLRATPEKFKENFHMSVSAFDKLFSLVEPHLRPKKKTHSGNGIPPIGKFAAVLEFLAGGALQRHVASTYRMSKQHFGSILDEVCNAISKALKDEIPVFTRTVFEATAQDFEHFWNFPNCLGAIDGKHVPIRCPPNAGSLFYNYKGFHSIVLMAIADANYNFLFVDIGAHGSEGDASVFGQSKLGRAIYNNELPYPQDRPVDNKMLPYVFVGDDAFPLHTRILKPYVPKKGQRLADHEQIFNYRLSRARRCVENAFGILCSRWYALGRTMLCSPDRAQKIVMACIHLHNFLLRTNKDSYCPSIYADTESSDGSIIQGEWRKRLPANTLPTCNLQIQPGRLNRRAIDVRNDFSEYFSTTGAVDWQNTSSFL